MVQSHRVCLSFRHLRCERIRGWQPCPPPGCASISRLVRNRCQILRRMYVAIFGMWHNAKRARPFGSCSFGLLGGAVCGLPVGLFLAVWLLGLVVVFVHKVHIFAFVAAEYLLV